MSKIISISHENEKIQVAVTNNSIPATSFAQFKITQTCPPGDTVPIRLYDPGFKNTAVCKSKISFVDGEAGKLYYRGYDVEELVERSTYLEVAYLLIYGELPAQEEYQSWVYDVMHHTFIHTELDRQMSTFRYDAHPMAMMIATIASLSTFHPLANPALQGDAMYLKRPTDDEKHKEKAEAYRKSAIFRMLGKIPTIAANTYRHRQGRPFNMPMPSNNYTENILYMMDRLNESDYRPNSRLVRILDKLFIILAEHGTNCSSVMMRHLASSGVDPYSALAGAAGALFGERNSREIIDMLKEIGSPENVLNFLETFKVSKSQEKGHKKPRLMGFGHRIYKTVDPRAKIAKQLLCELIDLLGTDKLAEIAFELEEKVQMDEYFTSRQLYPNVDFWTCLIIYMLDFPSDMFPVWMFIPRVSGMIAHFIESIDDPEFKIFRPRQVYVGHVHRSYLEDKVKSPTIRPLLNENSAPVSRPVDRRASKAIVAPDLLRQMNIMQNSLEQMSLSLTSSGTPNSDQAEMIAKMEKDLQEIKKKYALYSKIAE